ncbi:MAG: serine/threonine-protein phosphatase [Acidobacteria bacterium]|nr:MAG: serine/threonine-protein phosphatase [Acidobacteriota bacterium]
MGVRSEIKRGLLVIDSAALTDVGRRRQINEDRYRLDPDARVFILADGMGGHAAGSIAAETAVATIHGFLQLFELAAARLSWPFGYDADLPFEHNALRTAFRMANERIIEMAMEKGCWGMGTTAVATWIRNGTVHYAHVGDNRLYLLRSNRLELLTRDHTLVAEQVRRGLITIEQARMHPLRRLVTRAIGSREPFSADVSSLPLLDGDYLLLCSDGLTDQVSSDEMREILGKEGDLETKCRQLVTAANESGGNDDVTVIVLRNRGGR